MGWVYQYFYMVQCTRQRAAENETDNQKDYTTEMRRLIYTEFSVMMPLLLVSTMMPSATGIDAWRVQTVFFGSWTLYTLLGLHLRYRKSLSGENAGQPDFEDAVPGIDGLGCLTHAIVLVSLLTLNALGENTFNDAPYATAAFTQSRWGKRLIILVAAVFLFETLVKSITIRMKRGSYTTENFERAESKVKEIREAVLDKTGLLPSFSGNLTVLT